jgi:hypothetical protein
MCGTSATRRGGPKPDTQSGRRPAPRLALFPTISLRVAVQRAMRGVANAWPEGYPGGALRLAHGLFDQQRILEK